MPKTVFQALTYNKDAHELIWSQLKSTQLPSSARLDLVYAYLSIVLEHQHAIMNLVRNELHGSAFALFRPQVEAGFRGSWVNLISSDEEVAAIRQRGAEPFPTFKEMTAKLDEKYGSDGWLAGFADHWKALNGYAHTGLEQLGRRFREDGNIEPAYTEEMISELLISSATFSIGMFIPIFRTVGLEDKAGALEKWLADQPE